MNSDSFDPTILIDSILAGKKSASRDANNALVLSLITILKNKNRPSASRILLKTMLASRAFGPLKNISNIPITTGNPG
jgi:hypothetical protein